MVIKFTRLIESVEQGMLACCVEESDLGLIGRSGGGSGSGGWGGGGGGD